MQALRYNIHVDGMEWNEMVWLWYLELGQGQNVKIEWVSATTPCYPMDMVDANEPKKTDNFRIAEIADFSQFLAICNVNFHTNLFTDHVSFFP